MQKAGHDGAGTQKLKKAIVRPEDFDLIALAGRGGFGKVFIHQNISFYFKVYFLTPAFICDFLFYFKRYGL